MRKPSRPRITYLQPQRVDRHIAAQRYYLLAMSQVADTRISNQSLIARPFSGPDQKAHAAFRASLLLSRIRRRSPDSGATGQYVAEIDGGTVRFAIDCTDSGLLREREQPIADWSDVYFKVNRWPTLEYEPKVRPLLNSNGWLNTRRVEHLRGLRSRPKDIDVSFVSNIWGGREHNVRLFEQLARVNGQTELKAIFPPDFQPDETNDLKDRLRAAAVATSDKHVRLRDLTEILARSKVVFFRAGKSLCLPWRTIDLLALGSCVVIDSRPFPEWYVPLRSGVNFVDCGIERPTDTSAAPADQYEAIAPTVQSLLADEASMEQIRTNNAAYFDRHAAPLPLGEHIVAELRRHLRERGAA